MRRPRYCLLMTISVSFVTFLQGWQGYRYSYSVGSGAMTHGYNQESKVISYDHRPYDMVHNQLHLAISFAACVQTEWTPGNARQGTGKSISMPSSGPPSASDTRESMKEKVFPGLLIRQIHHFESIFFGSSHQLKVSATL